MDIGKLISHLISIAMVLGTLGLLRMATLELKNEAMFSKNHLVSLGSFSRRLQTGRSTGR